MNLYELSNWNFWMNDIPLGLQEILDPSLVLHHYWLRKLHGRFFN